MKITILKHGLFPHYELFEGDVGEDYLEIPQADFDRLIKLQSDWLEMQNVLASWHQEIKNVK